MTPQRLHAELSGDVMSKAYLIGALHDATERYYTYRISQKSKGYVSLIKEMILEMGYKAWVYREGKSREVYVVEFSKNVLVETEIRTKQEKIDYIRGYFDAEGSVPKKKDARMYIYFAQKNRVDLEEVRSYLEELGIHCGNIHNPSERVDSNYWRFFVSSKSYKRFAQLIGSNHPRKQAVLEMVI